MQVGINPQIDPNVIQFYESNYDVLRTPDFDDKSRLLKPTHGIKYLGHSSNKKWRFCGKDEHEVSFKKIAHVFPESIGNNTLASNYECDDCNQYFGSTIENEYANFFSLYHSIMQVSGKNGKPKCGFKVPCSMRTTDCANHCIEIAFSNSIPYIRKCENVDTKYVDILQNSITISKPLGACCPIAVFKAIVKMALTVMPVEEVLLFDKTIKWLYVSEHSNFYSNKKLLVRYKMIPGFNVTKYPHYILFRRKKTVWNMPYMLFNLTYGCFSLFVEIPRDPNDFDISNFIHMPFPPIPFFSSTTGIWDMSDNKLPQGSKQSITLTAHGIKECTNNVTITTENGKIKLNFSTSE